MPRITVEVDVPEGGPCKGCVLDKQTGHYCKAFPDDNMRCHMIEPGGGPYGHFVGYSKCPACLAACAAKVRENDKPRAC